jgi:predicted ester cyclase
LPGLKLASSPVADRGAKPLPLSAKELVQRFYDEVWNKADEGAARDILGANFRFRASLGPELRGPGGFIAYLRSVHAALGNFVCTIEELVATSDRAAARMSFRGKHRGKFFGIAATGRDIHWSGAAFFKIDGGVIAELWVLGDIDAVKRQLMADDPTQPF